MSKTTPGPVRTLSTDERFRWGECPVCLASHGEPCDFRVGAHLGTNIRGDFIKEGAHLARLGQAPFRVREVSADD